MARTKPCPADLYVIGLGFGASLGLEHSNNNRVNITGGQLAQQRVKLRNADSLISDSLLRANNRSVLPHSAGLLKKTIHLKKWAFLSVYYEAGQLPFLIS